MTTPSLLAAGSVVDGRYALVEPAPDRGRGDTWLAKDTAFRSRMVTLKLLQPVEGEGLPPRLSELLTSLRSLRHANILPALDHGLWQGRPYLVLEGFSGSSLGVGLEKARTLGRPLELQVLRAIAEAIVTAVEAARESSHPLVHGALDPRSVLLQRLPGRSLELRVLDFGLGPWTVPPGGSLPEHLPPLLAPELAVRASLGGEPEATPGGDVYALGVLCAWLLSNAPARGAGGESVPEAVWSVLKRASSAEPEARQGDVATLRQELSLAWSGALAARAVAPSQPSLAREETLVEPARAVHLQDPLPEVEEATARRATGSVPEAPDTLVVANFPPDLDPWTVAAPTEVDPLDAEVTVERPIPSRPSVDDEGPASFPPGSNPWLAERPPELRPAVRVPPTETRPPYASPSSATQEMVPRSSAEKMLMAVAALLALVVVLLLALLLR